MTRTAFTYDPFSRRHTQKGHPENYLRLESTWALLQSDGIVQRLQRIEPCPASHERLLAVHTPQHVERLRTMAEQGGGRFDSDTYVGPDSYEAALRAAGGLLQVTDAVLTGAADNGFALVRPPGHHALAQRGMGFCLLANVAIAARHAQQQHGVERVLIVDFDVHHGNGTQDIFYDDPTVLFFSTHQYPYYPGTGAAEEVGSEFAYGTTINVPLPPAAGDAGVLDAFRRVLAPAARDFAPGLILLSAGYDAHWMDPLAGVNFSIAGYTALMQELMSLADELCDGRLVCALEGGYHLDVLPHAVLSTLRTLSGEGGPSDPFGAWRGRERDLAPLVDGLASLHNLKAPPTHFT